MSLTRETSSSDIYQHLSSLSNSLWNETRITARRLTGRKILEIISNVKKRQLLTRECGGNKDGLFQIWRLMVKSALHASEKCLDQSTSGKSRLRLTKEDVTLPFRILTFCDDYVNPSRSRNENGSFSPVDEPFTFDSFYRYRGSQSHLTKMGSREIASLLNFCLNCLASDQVLNIAEKEMLDFINLLCSRSDYVVHFHPYRQLIENILEELQPRIVSPECSARGNELSLKSARAFCSLIHQSSWKLGLSMHMFIRPCIEMVSTWCHDQMSNTHQFNSPMISYLYNAVTNLLVHNSEQSIAVMCECGHSLLNFAKKAFAFTRGMEKQALLDYLSSHLLICEVAASLQGLWSGTLGDVGVSTLDYSQIDFLLNLLLSGKELEKLEDQNDEMRGGKKSDRKAETQFKPLTKLQLRYFELCARLLRHSQRIFLARAEISSFRVGDKNDLTQAILDEFESSGQSYNGLGSKTANNILPSTLSSCPWINFVGQHTICDNLTLHTIQSKLINDRTQAKGNNDETCKNSADITFEDSKFSNNGKLLLFLAAKEKWNSLSIDKQTHNESFLVPSLQLISACAEAFPRGECWSSTNEWKCSKENILQGTYKKNNMNKVSYFNVSTVEDIAAIVYSVGYLLEVHGGANGNQTVQFWSLVCLLKLTESSVIICRYWCSRKYRSAFSILATAWRSVWDTLFRSDLRYSSSTKSATPMTLGEIVLLLLTEMIRSCCLDPHLVHTHLDHNRLSPDGKKENQFDQHSYNVKADRNTLLAPFLYSRQHQVWSLPIYNNPTAIKISSPFELASVFIQSAGLSEGTDSINASDGSFSTNEISESFSDKRLNSEALEQNGRRYRLSCFCLKFIYYSLDSKEIQLLRRTLPFISACFASLLGFHSIVKNSTYSMESFRFFRCTIDSESPTGFFTSRESLCTSPTGFELNTLWSDSISPFYAQYKIEENEQMWRLLQNRDARIFSPACDEDRYWKQILNEKVHSTNYDHISAPIMKEFKKFALKCLTNIIQNDTLSLTEECGRKLRSVKSSINADMNSSQFNAKSIFYLILIMKFAFCIGVLGSNESDKGSLLELIINISQPILKTISTDLIQRSSTSTEFSWLIVDCIGFFRTLKNMTAMVGKEYASMLCGETIISQIIEMCKNIIKLHPSSKIFEDTPPQQVSPEGRVSTHCDKDETLLSDSEFLSEDEIEPNCAQVDFDSSNKRKRSSPKLSRQKRVKLSLIENADAKRTFGNEMGSCSTILDSPHVMLCASLLVILESTLDATIRITDSLLWYDEAEDNTVKAIPPEPHDALLCLSTMCSHVMNNHRNPEGESLFSILLQIILTGRADASSSTPYIMLGFSASPLIMNLLDVHDDMTEHECEYLLNVIHPEASNEGSKRHRKQMTRALKTRPILRSRQIQCATDCFREAGLIFHEKFDQTFSHVFIILPITDVSNSLVRYSAIKALQAAIEHMSSQRIIFTEVLNVMPQVWTYTSNEEKDDTQCIKKWIESKLLERGEIFKETSIEHKSWIDIKRSFEFDAIRSIGVLGTYTSEIQISREIMFKLIDMASKNPKMLSISFYWLEQIAMNRDFPNVEAMIFEEKEWFLQQWILQKKSLFDIPIIVSSPEIFRCTMRFGGIRNLTSKTNSSRFQIDRDRVKSYEKFDDGGVSLPNPQLSSRILLDDGLCGFILKAVHSAIPLILMIPSGSNEKIEAIDRKGQRWKYLVELTNILIGNTSDTDIRRVLKNHLHDIYAHIYPVLCMDCVEASSTNKNEEDSHFLSIVKHLISDDIIHRNLCKKSNILVQRLLQLSGRDINYYGVSLERSSYVRAIRFVAHKLNLKKRKKGISSCLFKEAGSSAIECILQAQKMLLNSQNALQSHNCWNVIKLICEEVTKECSISTKNSQLGFCINIILNISLNSNYTLLRLDILSTLKWMLDFLIVNKKVDDNRQQIGSVINKFCLAMIQIHEKCLFSFIDCCVHLRHEETTKKRKKQGLMQLLRDEHEGYVRGLKIRSSDMPIEYDKKQFKAVFSHTIDVDQEITDTLVLSFDLLHLLLDEQYITLKNELQVLDPFPVSDLSQEQIKIIQQYNNKFCLQNLLKKFEERNGVTSHGGLESHLESFLAFYKRFGSNNLREDMFIPINNCIESTNFESYRFLSQASLRALLAALVKIRIALQNQNLSDIPSKLSVKVYKVIEFLLILSKHKHPEISNEISRCLGELSKIDLAKFSLLDIINAKELSKMQKFFDDPIFWFKTRSLKSVALLVESENIDTAILAKDTAKALLQTNTAFNCIESIHSQKLKQILITLSSDKDIVQDQSLSLSHEVVEKIKSFACIDSRDLAKNEWCWSKDIWTCCSRGEVSYENWVKNLVCAIIICNYGNGTSGQYFSLCARLCYQEHAFAVSIFPAIIYDLLDSDRDDIVPLDESPIKKRRNSRQDNRAQDDVVIGSRMSRTNHLMTNCFSYILKESCSHEISDTGITPHTFESIDKQSISSNKLRILELIIPVMDMFRCITMNLFLSSKSHKTNPRKLKTRKYPYQNGHERNTAVVDMKGKRIPDKLYNENLGDSVVWRGVPYGVVFHVNGMELASACLESKLHVSSLYYIEMYADNQFGGSGKVLERLTQTNLKAESCIEPYSMSGYGIYSHICDNPDKYKTSLDNIRSFQNLLRKTFAILGERENVKGTEMFKNIIQFDINGLTGNMSTCECKSLQNGDNFQSLIDLDINLQQAPWLIADEDLHLSENGRSMINCLNNLGLRHISEQYVASLRNNDRHFSAVGKAWLDEKWSEKIWRLSQWDDYTISTHNSSHHLNSEKSLVNDFSIRKSTFEPTSSVGLQDAIRASFDCIMKEDSESFTRWLGLGRIKVLEDMNKKLGLENFLPSLSDFNVKFRILNEIEQLGSVCFHNMPAKTLLKKWDLDNSRGKMSISGIKNTSFATKEFFMSVREVAIRILCKKYGLSGGIGLNLALNLHLMSFCDFARKSGRPNIAESALIRLRMFQENCRISQEDSSYQVENSMRIHLEESKILKSRSDSTAAIRSLKLLINSIKNIDESSCGIESHTKDCLLAECLLQCGEWLANHKLASGTSILNDYLKPSVDILSSFEKRNETAAIIKLSSSANFALGAFVSNLYESVRKRMSSHEWKKTASVGAYRVDELSRCKEMMEKINKNIGNLKSKSSKSMKTQDKITLKKQYDEIYIHHAILQKEVDMDKKERISVEKSADKYLLMSINAFGSALSNCENRTHYTKYVYRMISLWFGNQQEGKHSDINIQMQKLLENIPSFWFVPLAYQIFSRIDTIEEQNIDFQRSLQWLVLKICKEHPYHSIVQLIALSNGKKIGCGVSGRNATTYLDNVGASKVEAAGELLHNLRTSGLDFVSGLVHSYQALTDAYIQLAMAPTDKMIKSNMNIKNINFCEVGQTFGVKRQLDQCLSPKREFPYLPCILTRPPILQPNGDYKEGQEDPLGSERLRSFNNSFSLTETGVHRPKVVLCRGTRGGTFKQVVKGEDDIRQDAIMEQVFITLNSLLKSKSDSDFNVDISFAKKLKVITYNILPLSPTCGVLEWVDDTIPIGDYLTDKGSKPGAHSKYYPGEWGNHLCRIHLQNAPVDRKREAFDEICKQFSPAFRFFFYERFSFSLQAWHVARMNYAISCAVSSIVGHVLGIGDRHSHNILIHQKTGELVHIDFGVVFEQGKCLTVPETVPFRLTRDMVDGLGPLGTEGAFTAAAEATMSVLRENSNTIMSVLSAVVSDPLYKWSISPVSARQRQLENHNTDGIREKSIAISSSNQVPSTSKDNENDAAILALAKVQEKLQGYEEGLSGERQSIEGQVQFLINSATDNDNLSVLFPGWAPWL